MSPNFQLHPPHKYATAAALLKACPQPEGTVLLSVADNQRLFGDVSQSDFEQKNIVAVKLPGFGPNRSGYGTARVHRILADTFLQAFEAIHALGLSYYFKPFGSASTFCIRYAKVEENRAALEGAYDYYKRLDNPGKLSWNVLYAGYDYAHGRLGDKVGKKTKLDHLSKHSWGSAFDLNPSENPLGTGKEFDLPFEVVKVLGKYGVYWGGYFVNTGADFMHFQWGRNQLPTGASATPVSIVSPSHVVFPFGEPGKRESPTKYFFLNEHHGRGGYFPLGLYQNLHGGIHLNPLLAADTEAVADSDLPDDPSQLEGENGDSAGGAAEPAPAKTSLLPVHAALPGYIVAARLVDPDLYKDNQTLRQNLEGQPLGFVLIRHELKAVLKKDEKDSGKRWPLYSLYMHLAAPKWDAASEDDKKADKSFEAAPWLEKFLRMEYGGVVALDPEKSDEFGKTFWAKQKFEAKGTDAVPVRGREEPLPRVDGDSGDRVVGFGKPSPDPIAQAIARFKQGAVVTFDRPVLPVAAGEVIGFLDGAAGAGHSRRYLHWEMFAQPDQGLAKIRDLAKDLDLSFPDPLKELCEDNFLEMPSLHDPGAKDEISAFFKQPDPVLNPVIKKARYAKKLVEAFQKGEEFAQGSKKPFRYTTTLNFANPYHFRPEEGVDAKVKVTYLASGKPLEAASDASPTFGDAITLTLDVPAAADLVRLQSPLFRLDLAPPPPAAGSGDKKDDTSKKRRESLSKGRRALWKAVVTGRRWRDLVIEHVNEWTADNLAKYIKTKVKAAYFDSTGEQDRDKLCKELEEALAPLTWYAPPKAEDKPHGEQPALGDGARKDSLFGADGTFLPKDGHLESMHPATTLWLLDLLLEEGKVALEEAWKADNLIAAKVADDPLFLGVTVPAGGGAVGATVGLALIQQGYEFSSTCADTGVRFVAHPEDHEPRILALASYVEGAAVAKVRFPFWRKTKIEVLAQQKGSNDGRALKPAKEVMTALDLPPPERQGMELALVRAVGGKPNDRVWSGTILTKEGCPYALEGYLAFNYWKADAGKQPDLAQPGAPGTCVWPVVAERSPLEEHDRDGLKWKGDFIVGVAGKKTSPRTVHVSTDYVLGDFMNKRIAEAESDKFRLAMPLVQRLQTLRDACKSKKGGGGSPGFSVQKLAANGMFLTLASNSVPAILDRASALPPSDLFTLEANPDGKTLQLTYSPTDTTGILTFTTDLGPALQALANAVSSKSGEQIFARPIFLAPNGGHHVFTHLDQPPDIAEDHVVMAKADDVVAASVGDCIQLESDVVLPPAHAFGFGPLVITMGRSSLCTSVDLLGPAQEWAHAKISITCKVGGEEIPGGARERDHVSDSWYLEKWHYDKKGKPVDVAKHRWGNTFDFTIEAASSKSMPSPPAPIHATFDATPKLLKLEAQLVDQKVVFAGEVHAVPTSAELAIRCQRQAATGEWVDDAQVASALRYRRHSAQSPGALGSPDENGSFGAEAECDAFTPSSYRFTLYVASLSDPKSEKLHDDLVLETSFGFSIDPLTSRTYTGVELGGSVKAATDDRTANDGLHGEGADDGQ